jgi:hypothetical protein
MKTRFSIVSLGIIVGLIGLQLTAMAQEKGYSHIRIVRLSFVNGTVLVKRPGATEWAKALVNTPIEQGFTVSTSNNGFAETQFENGSTARLGEMSRMDFAELALAPSGAKINHLVFDDGYGTFNFRPQHGDAYSVQAGSAMVTPDGKSEFRIDLQPAALRVEVFDGSVKVVDGGREVSVGKGKTLDVNLNGEVALNVTHGIHKDAWDTWVQGRDQQTELALNDSAIGMDSPVAGWSDLDQYGEWAYLPGYGYGWSPFVDAGWTPFSMGLWSFYPGMGYTWISSEPWGWLPFHYGFWNYNPAFGYFWMPGGGFNSFYPGLVDWFGAPGYIGWAPMGFGGLPVCTTAACITTATTTAFAGGGVVRPMRPVSLRLTSVGAINVAPGPRAMLSGVPVSQRVMIPGEQSAIAGEGSSSTAIRFSGAAAPGILFMGQTPAQGRAEIRALTAHHSLFNRAFAGNVPHLIQVRNGNTLGGRYMLASRGSGMGGIRPMSRSSLASPMFLGHRSYSGFSSAGPRMQASGEIRQAGGADRGFSNPGFSAPSASMRASSPGISSAPSGGGAHGAGGGSSGGHH